MDRTIKFNIKSLLTDIFVVVQLIFILIIPLLNNNTLFFVATAIGGACCLVLFVVNRGIVKFTKVAIVWLFTLIPLLLNSYAIKHHIYGYTLSWIVMLLFFIIGALESEQWMDTAINTVAIVTCLYAFTTILLNLNIDCGISAFAQVYKGSDWQQGTLKMAGITSHYSINGVYISLGAIAWFAKACKTKKKWHFAMTIVFVLALVFTEKRGPLIALIIAFALTYFIANLGLFHRKVAGLFIGVIVLFVGVFVVYTLHPEMFGIVERFSDNDIMNNRDYLWAFAIKSFLSNPVIGMGWGSYSAKVVIYVNGQKYDNIYAHNIYLQLLAETGIVGMLIFVAAIVITLIVSIKVIRYIVTYGLEGTINTAPILFSTALQIFFIIYGFTGNPLYDKQMYIPYMIAIGIAIYYSAKIRSRKTKTLSEVT